MGDEVRHNVDQGNNKPSEGGEKDPASAIRDKLTRLSPDSVSYSTVCIYKVPEKHRKKNPDAYTPQLVSIGLIHSGESQLQGMERYKLKYLQDFLHIFRVPLEKIVDYVVSQEKFVCDCYEDIYLENLTKFKKKPFDVMMLDGIFIVVLLLKNHFVGLREEGDIIFQNPWVSSDILHDLLLFENQLPLKFLKGLYDKFVVGNVRKSLDDDAIYPVTFNELVHRYFRNVGTTDKLVVAHDFRQARHFVEFLSILHNPNQPKKDSTAKIKHGKKRLDFASCPTATQLKAVGVKFLPGTKNGLLDVKFDKNLGELTIPQLTVNDSSETFFRNVIAFEQFGSHLRFITSYVILLDNLIDTPKDVDILINNNIIKNELGSSQQVADLFNNLHKEILTDPKEFYYSSQCYQLNDYSRNMWHTIYSILVNWFVILGRDYFSSPWSVISFIVAAILLGLTIAQTVYSVLSYQKA